MKKIPAQFVQDLKHSLNIVEVAGQYIHLQKKGGNYFGLCPFHTEKTPSFSVSEQRQLFYCFGCQQKGDVITLVMELDGLSYVEAVQALAEKANMRIPFEDAGEEKEYRDRKFLYTVMEEAAAFYEKCLQGADGRAAREYLARRRIDAETVSRFRLGYAPVNGYHLLTYLRSLGIKDPFILDAGLAGRSQKSGKLYDQFRQRLMIPILDLHGRIIAFGGRILGDGEPKYLNSRETPVYQKSRHLFGLQLSQRAIREQDEAILVEGYFDMMVPWQAGVTHTVASLGTSLTSLQVKLLGRFTKNVLICFDPDSAGANAAHRSVELFLENDFECRVLILPEGMDPDTYALEYGRDGFQKLITEALPFLDFMWRRFHAQYAGNLTTKNRIKLLEQMFPFLMKIPRPTERSMHLSRLANRLGIDQPSIFRQFKRYARTQQVDADRIRLETASGLLESEKLLLKYIITYPEKVSQIFYDSGVTFSGLRSSNILSNILQMLKEKACFCLQTLESSLPQEDLLLLHKISLDDSSIISEEDALNCFSHLRARALEQEIQQLVTQMQDAEKEGDIDRCRTLLQQKKELERKKGDTQDFIT
ncbi:MAG: DNA primase [Acidobacteria bacterium]|nr:DNA primase [Acidobacteriota bacterium]